MIHTIYVTPEETVAGLKKLFRKKLMTGGGVIRLKEDLSSEDLQAIAKVFSADGTSINRHSVEALVLEEVAKHPKLPEDVKARLAELPIAEIQTALRLP